MVSSDKKLANAVGGRTARACDNCVRKRARWFCVADDVFLCQSCDVLVHSANPLARRHERVHLKTASLKLSSLEKSMPTWDQGFTKKPRTPRGNNNNNKKHKSHQTPKSEESTSFNPLCLVPEIGSDEYETTTMNSEDQLLYQVPVFDPFAAELCFSRNFNEVVATPTEQSQTSTFFAECHGSKVTVNLNNNGLIPPSDMDLAEFAADVESLLGNGLDEESFDMEGLGLLDCKYQNDSRASLGRVKVEEEMQSEVVESETEMMREPFQLSFDYNLPEDEKVVVEDGGGGGGNHMGVVKEDEECEVVGDDHLNIHTKNHDNIHGNSTKKRLLKLDYEGIIAAWDGQRSPWTTGDRPELDLDDCWPQGIGGCRIMQHQPWGDVGMTTGNTDGGREARVLRYKEKRRTRLFSKKIRYEVRKLNAEKRPRMKGRFVKRTNFGATNRG